MTSISTIAAMADRSDRPEDLVGAGEILDMRLDCRKSLSLRAAKLLHLLIKEAGARACESAEHSALISLLNQEMHLSIEEFLQTAEELMDVRLRLRVPDGEGGKPEIWLDRLIHSVKRPEADTAQAMVRYRLSDSLRKVLENSAHWAILSRKALLAFESRYALRLYEMIALRIGLARNTERFDLKDLRERLGVQSDKLLTWDAFNRRALETAIAEVNQLSGFIVSATPYKSGRAITGVTLKWRMAPASARVKALRELEASRVGRSARRSGLEDSIIETVSPPGPAVFPMKGDLSNTAWARAAILALPRPQPALDEVAVRFRDFCGRKGILLSHPQIADRFAKFCADWQPE